MRGAHGGKHRHDRRRGCRRRRGEEERRRRSERVRWHNRWYILPGGSQGRGEGGSAIRQHTQEGGGQTLAVGIKSEREDRRGERRLRKHEAGEILYLIIYNKYYDKTKINTVFIHLIKRDTYFLHLP